MPTPNAIFGALQPSAIFAGTPAASAADPHPLCDQGAGVRSYQELQQQQQHLAHHEQRQIYPPPQHHYGHGPSRDCSHSHSHAHLNTPSGPDPAVMEFISKIGQIIIKARTVSPTLTFSQTAVLGTGSAVPSNADSSGNNSSLLQQQNLEMVLQDMDLWRSSTPVHVNILHTAQHALLERWVISYTPAAAPASSPMASMADSARAKSPYTGYLSPMAKHLQPQSMRSPSTPASASSASAHPKDTTDLVLLLQSLYTQIRSLPLQNCLTSFDDQTKLTKSDLAYSVTSAHEDITQSRQDRTPFNSQDDLGDAPITDSLEERYSSFTASLKSTLPLEFVNSASLKVINFEASHVQWGFVRVTGMYDESVGGRIRPENFQDSTKIQKKRHHRRKASSSTDASDSAARRQQKNLGSWTSISQPVKADISSMIPPNAVPGGSPKSLDLKTGQTTIPKSEDMSTRPSQPSIPEQKDQLSSVAASSSEDQFRAQLQSLKRNSDMLFSSLSSPRTQLHNAIVNERQEQPYKSVLQESLLPKHETRTDSSPLNKERMQSYQFPPPPSPPLSIPLPRKASIGEQPAPSSPSPESEQERTPTSAGSAPHRQRKRPSPLQQSPPFFPQQYHHVHTPFSTSPLTHVITRRRSSRLSIVMTCNDDSPDPTRPQSPLSTTIERDPELSLDDDTGNTSSYQSSDHFRRRGSLQEQRHAENQMSKPPLGQSPTRATYLRRSSLNPSSLPHGDLFGSLVGSYEESILSGRMSTLPSKPLIFTAQIGVLANQDYKDCPPKLRCPKHVQLEFPAVFYDYESSSSHHGSHHTAHHHQHHHSLSHSHSHQHQLHYAHSAHSSQPKAAHSFGHHISTSPSHHSLGSFASSPALTQDDPVLPYVGNLDLDNGFRGSRRFARMPGGMRIPLRGQVQVMIKNPNKTVVKVFLVPYDFTDMPAGTKTFLRQKYYSTSPGMGPVTSNANNGGTLRYAIHLQFCCPAPGYVYLYRSIRVVFANRVPDGKESLRVVLEGLGLGSRTICSHGTKQILSTPAVNASELTPTAPKSLEERYVKMRKGEVSFSGSRRKMEQNSVMDLSMDGDDLLQSSSRGLGLGLGLGLDKDYSNPSRPHGTYDSSLAYRPRFNFDGQPFNSRALESQSLDTDMQDMDMDVDMDQIAIPYHMSSGSRKPGMAGPLSSPLNRAVDGIPSSMQIGNAPTLKSPGLSPMLGGGSSTSSTSSPLSTPYHPKESSLYFGPGTMSRKESSHILGI
ncbi:hypothetical protein BGZ58_001154 [Dissophora ornata]|nr:hypothetical protein BGZ58_001154 [Dissophora ornata]